MSNAEQLPVREKFWEELTDPEKIERMADRLEYLQRIVNGQARVIEKLENHVHVGGTMFFRTHGVDALGWPNDNILQRNPESRRSIRRIDR